MYTVRKDMNRILSLMGQIVDSDGHEGILGSGNALDPGVTWMHTVERIHTAVWLGAMQSLRCSKTM